MIHGTKSLNFKNQLFYNLELGNFMFLHHTKGLQYLIFLKLSFLR